MRVFILSFLAIALVGSIVPASAGGSEHQFTPPPALGTQVREPLKQETKEELPAREMKPIIHVRYVDQVVEMSKTVKQPVVRQQVIEQPIIRTRVQKQPVIRRIIEQTVIRPHVVTPVTIVPVVRTETTVRNHYIDQTQVQEKYSEVKEHEPVKFAKATYENEKKAHKMLGDDPQGKVEAMLKEMKQKLQQETDAGHQDNSHHDNGQDHNDASAAPAEEHGEDHHEEPAAPAEEHHGDDNAHHDTAAAPAEEHHDAPADQGQGQGQQKMGSGHTKKN
jgi:hypothetical protein